MENFVENFSDARAWDGFIARHAGPDGGLLQSWAWGEVQKNFGRRVWRMAELDGKTPVFGWQVIEHRLPLAQRYWYVPRPTKFPISNFKIQNFFNPVVLLAKKENVIFLRVDGGESSVLERFGFTKVTGSVQPLEELIMDVSKKPEELLAAMKQKTRYNIRLAEKHGVQILEEPLNAGGLAVFLPLVLATAARQKIRLHPATYYRAMFDAFSRAGNGRLLVARYQGEPVAAALLVAGNGVLTYLHGGSADAHGEVMAPHLLHWHGIQLAQRMSCRAYNFGGVSETNAAWTGLTRFKQGFCPVTKFTPYVGLCDRPVRKIGYRMYRIGRSVRT
ncbi:MAG: peptidoglycan bridge formation glycyltransferase FemA/FemB family protein [Patescibacteria group bacterium]|nr:peptidoglycan bridge formation glycyltransferase FemA/FemB family protein [Patescibacteria group bacterium]